MPLRVAQAPQGASTGPLQPMEPVAPMIETAEPLPKQPDAPVSKWTLVDFDAEPEDAPLAECVLFTHTIGLLNLQSYLPVTRNQN